MLQRFCRLIVTTDKLPRSCRPSVVEYPQFVFTLMHSTSNNLFFIIIGLGKHIYSRQMLLWHHGMVRFFQFKIIKYLCKRSVAVCQTVLQQYRTLLDGLRKHGLLCFLSLAAEV